jgi:hypothetical protein
MSNDLRFEVRPEVRIIVKQHSPACQYSESHRERDCRCPKYFYVSPGSHRVPAKTSSWEMARTRARKWEDDHDPRLENKPEPGLVPITVADAFDEMVKHKSNAGAGNTVVSKFKTLKKKMLAFLAQYNQHHQPVEFVHQITAVVLDGYQETWRGHTLGSASPAEDNEEIEAEDKGLSRLTAERRRGNLIEFFNFCLARNYIHDTGQIKVHRGRAVPKDNPAYAMKVVGLYPVVSHEPFSDELEAAIFAACDRYDASIKTKNRDEVDGDGYKLKLLCRLMSATGLAVTDAVTTRRDSLGDHERNRIKTNKGAYIEIDPELGDELRKLPNDNPLYLFWSGKSAKSRAASPWHKKFQKLWELVDRELLKELKGDPGTHCFRNTFARRLFEAGANETEVAKMLGATEAIVRRHYSKMCKERQVRLSTLAQATWHKNRTHAGLKSVTTGR